MRPAERLDVTGLLLPLHHELIVLLRSLQAADWQRPTACARWNVKDVAAHLLDGDLRKLSVVRDQHLGPPPELPIAGFADLTAYLNRLNHEWVWAARRISPRLLVDLLEPTGAQVCAVLAGLDPDADAVFPVAWAGEERSPVWFDNGREYTERWHHQQQIREAVGATALTQRSWLQPVLALFMRALPFAYRDVPAEESTSVVIDVQGDGGGVWTLLRQETRWHLYEGMREHSDARVTISADDAWRHFVKQLPAEAAARRIRTAGTPALAQPFLRAIAVMA